MMAMKASQKRTILSDRISYGKKREKVGVTMLLMPVDFFSSFFFLDFSVFPAKPQFCEESQ